MNINPCKKSKLDTFVVVLRCFGVVWGVLGRFGVFWGGLWWFGVFPRTGKLILSRFYLYIAYP